MTLLGELALAFLIESIALAVLWSAMGMAAGWLILTAVGARPAGLADLRFAGLAGLAGAMVVGSLGIRFGAPEPIQLAVGRREVPIVWSIGGALAGALIAAVAARRTRAA
ncbi:MAG: hypothetical protein MUP76_11555 [Acidimicrobiia bacterium]|nr:hypothetical protein [Acidimicrobiia bacterium]